MALPATDPTRSIPNPSLGQRYRSLQTKADTGPEAMYHYLQVSLLSLSTVIRETHHQRTHLLICDWCSALMTCAGYMCHLPIERSLHITEGVAKHAKTSSVQVNCVGWGNTIDWPLHWPHMYTWPLWVLAADVCAEWQAAISMTLSEKPEKSRRWMVVC